MHSKEIKDLQEDIASVKASMKELEAEISILAMIIRAWKMSPYPISNP